MDAADTWRGAVAAGTDPLARLVDVVEVPGRDEWAAVRGVEPDGALLVRPGTVVAWRSATRPADTADALDRAFAAVRAPVTS
ncbi:hypothetical protein [Cryptosporangium japonicum]|uniref:Uncharacterized protein n=1 Tax=Cryptosporangium japonicum TaxID=80872 RepID=A0ABN0UHM4_9ACTN